MTILKLFLAALVCVLSASAHAQKLGALVATNAVQTTDTIPVTTDSGANTFKTSVANLIPSALNVKNYGAKGDSRKVTDAVITNASTTVVSITAAFTAADVGKKIWGVQTATKLAKLPVGTITAVNSSSNITVSVSATASLTGVWLVWGTDDSDAIRSATSAAIAALPVRSVYVPPGGYVFKKLLANFADNPGVGTGNISFVGAGSGNTFFYPAPDYDITTTISGGGLLIGGTLPANVPMYATIAGFTIDGNGLSLPASHDMIHARMSRSRMDDVVIVNCYGIDNALTVISGLNLYTHLHIEANESGILCNGAGVTFVGCYSGNNTGYGLKCYAINGLGDTGNNVRWFGGLLDENGSDSVVLQNASSDVSFIGTKIWSTGGGQRALTVDSNSVVRIENSELGVYLSINNGTGLLVSQGGTAYIHSSRIYGNGTGVAVNNAGTVYDLGGNTFINGITGAINGPNTSRGGFSGTRSNLLAPASLTFPATTVNWTNPLPVSIHVVIDNAAITGTAIKKNGTQISSQTVGTTTIGLQVGEYFSETYTVGTPTATYFPFP